MFLPSSAELTYFLEIAHTLNMSRAAERLGVTQPTLSLSIQRLEHALGTAVLIRNKTGVQLTAAGQRLESQARILLNEWERVRQETTRAEGQLVGRYSIGCHPSVALYSLPRFMKGLLSENPGLEIKLVHDLSRRITEDVISYKIDFGLVVNPPDHPDLVMKPLCRDEVKLWASASADVNKQILLCDPELLQTQALLRLFAKKGLQFKQTIHSSNLEVIAALTASGAGIGLLPGRVATRLKEYKLEPYKTEIAVHLDRHYLVYRADAQRSKASKLLAQKIETAIKDFDA